MLVLLLLLAGLNTQVFASVFCPLYCQNPNPPSIVFPIVGRGEQDASSKFCCPVQYKNCTSERVCRVLQYYTIQSAAPSGRLLAEPENEEVATPAVAGNPYRDLGSKYQCTPIPANVWTPPQICQCQKDFAARSELTLQFCPKPENCCPVCNCHGDPHCVAFNATGTVDFWVCDSKDAECNYNKATCLAPDNKWDGQQCRWINTGGGKGYCDRAAGTAIPIMSMYNKLYLPAGGAVMVPFDVTLSLGVYGSINSMVITDGTLILTYGFNSGGQCTYSGPGGKGWGFNSKNTAQVRGLPSGVALNIECNTGAANVRRIDVWLTDPNYVTLTSANKAGGFCPTGVIKEAAGTTMTSCVISDKKLYQYYRCSGTMAQCQQRFCNSNTPPLDWSSMPCMDYIVAAPGNWLDAACLTSPIVLNGRKSVDGTSCQSDQACKVCVQTIIDYPETIRDVLTRQPPSPPERCNSLAQKGLTAPVLPDNAQGIQIDYQAPGTTSWVPKWKAFDEDLVLCPCQLMEFTSSNGGALMQPGKYRISQCSTTTTQICNTSPGYTSEVTYESAGGPQFSVPMGKLWDMGCLICAKDVYPACPTEYKCCIWRESQLQWEACMINSYGANYKTQYPNCKFIHA